MARTWLRRLGYLLRQSRHDAELREEMDAHRALRAAQLERDGVTPREAAQTSRRAVGNVLLAREDAREVWLGSWGTWWQDVRYGLRTFRRNPGFTVVAVITLALAIGVNAGMFTVLNGVLFRDLPAHDAHELVSIAQTVEGGPRARANGPGTFATSEYRAYRDRAQTLAGVLAHANPVETTLGGDAPQEVVGAIVSCNYFDVLQTPPLLGRGLTARDCEPGATPVVVLGHGVWTATFAADPGVAGRAIELDRKPFTVVGVAAESTYSGSPMRAGYFAPLSAEPLLRPGFTFYEGDTNRWLHLVGRRRDVLAQVRAELGVIAAQIDQQQPGRSTALTVTRATPMTVPPPIRAIATGGAAVLMAAFGLILLIACANVANLLLARGTARSQELGIRVSLGASRARVVRQLLTESMLIAIAGGVLGSVLALWSFQLLMALALPGAVPPELPAFVWALDVSPDIRVISFAMALTLGTGFLFGMTPALYASNPDLNAVMKQEVAGAGKSPRGGRLRGALVGVQIALSMVLMIATGLLLRGLYATYTIDPGFTYRDVAYLSFGTDYGPPKVVNERLMGQVAALPGVEAVAFTAQTPLGESNMGGAVRLPGQSREQQRAAELDAVTPGYFPLLGIRIVRGRNFTEAESANAGRDGGSRPVIVSEMAARSFWGDDDPVGRTLLFGDEMGGDIPMHVVGVASDAQLTSLGAVVPYIYQASQPMGVLLVKHRGDFGATASGILSILRAADPSLAARVLSLEGNLAWWRGVSRIISIVGGGLGVLALVLASVGIYGVVSFAVTRRRREIGIRIALGARQQDVLGTMLRQTMRPVAIGAAIGIVAASLVSRILASVLFGVSPADPIGLGGSALLVILVALAAGVLAASPATRADPTATLRAE